MKNTKRVSIVGQKYTPTINDLYPQLSPLDQVEAEANIERYFELILRIHKRIESEAKDKVPEAVKHLEALRSLAKAAPVLTGKEMLAFRTIKLFELQFGRQPSVRELMRLLGYKSPRSAAKVIVRIKGTDAKMNVNEVE